MKSAFSNFSNNKICKEGIIAKFGTKNAWFGYFGDGIWNQLCYFWNQHFQVGLIAKFQEIMHLRPKMPNLGISGLNLRKTLAYLKSRRPNCINYKILPENKNA